MNHSFLFASNMETDKISIEEISNTPLILPSTEGLGSYNIIHEAFTTAQLPLQVISECSDMNVLMQMVSSGIGSTIVPESVFKSYGLSNLFARDITDSTLKSSVGLIWLKQHHLSRPARNFIELVKQRLGITENDHE